MNEDNAKRFLNKSVRIKTNSEWFYRGRVTEITSDGLFVNDYKVGSVFIAFSDISTIENWSRERNG